MFSAVIDVHRNILSAQCYIKYEVRKTPVNNMQILCTKNCLNVSLFHDDELYKEIKVWVPDNLFIPNSVSKENDASCLIEIERDCFRVSQKSHYSKYRKVIERYLETSETCSPENANFYKRLKIAHNDGAIEDVKCLIADDYEIDFSQHCLPVQDVIEVKFRLQLYSSDAIPDSSIDSNSLLTLHEYFKTEIEANIPYVAVCSYCCKAICNSTMCFQDIKEFSNCFSDLSESWFCHKSATPSKSNMSDETLYVSDAHIFLNSRILDSLSIETKESQLVCKSCNTILTCGEEFDSSRKQFKRFFGDAIVFKKSDRILNLSDLNLRLKSVMLCLWSIINDKQLPLCRLFLQAKLEEDEDTCLLLWIPSVKVAQFKIQSCDETMPREMNFQTESVFKVKYHIGTLSSPLVTSWSKDFNVDFYKVSNNFIKTVVDILKSSSEYIPGGKTEAAGFFNGCIPCTFFDITRQ